MDRHGLREGRGDALRPPGCKALAPPSCDEPLDVRGRARSCFPPARGPVPVSFQGTTVRVVLYNIRYGTGTGWDYHLPLPFSGLFRRTEPSLRRLSSFIDGMKPDLVGLVEVDGGSYRHGGECQAKCLAENLDLDHFFSCKYRKGFHLQEGPGAEFAGKRDPFEDSCGADGKGRPYQGDEEDSSRG